MVVSLSHHAEVDKCVQCGMCLSVCPTHRALHEEMDSPRGRIYLMKEAAAGRIPLEGTFASHISLCLVCRACETVCPTGVRFGLLIEEGKRMVHEETTQSALSRLLTSLVFRSLLPSPRRLRALAAIGRLATIVGLIALLRALGRSRLLPLRWRFLLSILPSFPSGSAVAPPPIPFPAQGERRGSAALFWGCVMPLLYPGTHRATIRVLQRSGFDVSVPTGQVCCGALHLHNGMPEIARELAACNITAIERTGVDVLAVNSAGCGATLKEYPELFSGDPSWVGRARAFAAKVKDVSEIVASSPIAAPTQTLSRKVTYQDPCHLAHGQKVRAAPRRLLRSIPGIRFVEMREPDRCCGSAGIYNLLSPEVSWQILEAKMERVKETGAEILVTANPGCLLQLEAGRRQMGLDIEVVHLVDLLDRASGSFSPQDPDIGGQG